MVISNPRQPWKQPAPPVTSPEAMSSGWLPVEISPGNAPVVRWMNTGSAALSEPFFHNSVARLRAVSPEIETRLDALETGTAHLSPVLPAGIIFNMSRCGSTLLVNALRAADGVVGLSEAAPIERAMALSASRSAYWAERGRAVLTPLTTIFAHHQGEPPRRVVIKCAMGTVATLRHLRKSWPSVPCIVLIRNPVEVLVSNVEKPPQWLMSAYADNRSDDLFSGQFGVPPRDVLNSGLADLCAWAIGRYCTESMSAADDGCTVVDYEDLTPETVFGLVEDLGLTVSAESLPRFRGCFEVDAKNPRRSFENDRETKQKNASDHMLRALDRWVGASYDDLRRRVCQRRNGAAFG